VRSSLTFRVITSDSDKGLHYRFCCCLEHRCCRWAGLRWSPVLAFRGYPKAVPSRGNAVRVWASILCAITVLIIGIVESDAENAPACVIVEIPSEPPPNNTPAELDKLYAKVEPAMVAPASLPNRRTEPAREGSRAQTEVSVALPVREREFFSVQPWTIYCPLHVVSQPAPPTFASHQASDLSSREPARHRTAATRVASAGHYKHTSILRRVRLIYFHYQRGSEKTRSSRL
jgi:hypothetical protein